MENGFTTGMFSIIIHTPTDPHDNGDQSDLKPKEGTPHGVSYSWLSLSLEFLALLWTGIRLRLLDKTFVCEKMRQWIRPILLGVIITFSFLVVCFTAHFESLARSGGHGSQAFFRYTIVFGTLVFLNACAQALAIFYEAKAHPSSINIWRRLGRLLRGIAILLLNAWTLTANLGPRRADTAIIGGCLDDTDTNVQVCKEWRASTAFMFTTWLLIIVDYSLSWLLWAWDKCVDWGRRTRERRRANMTTSLELPLVPQQHPPPSSLLPDSPATVDPNPAYDAPSAPSTSSGVVRPILAQSPSGVERSSEQ